MCIKMKKIINRFLLAGDNFMLEMYWGQPRIMYNACEPFRKNKNENTKS